MYIVQCTSVCVRDRETGTGRPTLRERKCRRETKKVEKKRDTEEIKHKIGKERECRVREKERRKRREYVCKMQIYKKREK